jgi:26S proteasome regulatory subunit N6
MDKQPRLEEAAAAKKKGDVVHTESIYHSILSKSAGSNESALREQEAALIHLGELYRDQKCVPFVSQRVILLGRSRNWSS